MALQCSKRDGGCLLIAYFKIGTSWSSLMWRRQGNNWCFQITYTTGDYYQVKMANPMSKTHHYISPAYIVIHMYRKPAHIFLFFREAHLFLDVGLTYLHILAVGTYKSDNRCGKTNLGMSNAYTLNLGGQAWHNTLV